MSNQIDATFILHFISFICWTIVYLEAIRIGFRNKTYCIPFIALALNLNWELVHCISMYLESGIPNPAYMLWFFLDVLILITYFMYGRKYFPKNVNITWFLPWSILILIISLLIQFLFLEHFGPMKGRLYSAFIQSLIMSILFLQMFVERNSAEGQSLVIAVNKLVGTLIPTITFGVIGSEKLIGTKFFVLILGISCFFFDLLYVWIMHKVKRVGMQTVKDNYLF